MRGGAAATMHSGEMGPRRVNIGKNQCQGRMPCINKYFFAHEKAFVKYHTSIAIPVVKFLFVIPLGLRRAVWSPP